MLLLVQQRSERRASERADERSGQAGNTAASPLQLKTIPCGTGSRLDSFDVGGTLNAIGLEKHTSEIWGEISQKYTAEQLQPCVPTGAHGKR